MLSWACENQTLFRPAPAPALQLHYEHLVADTAREVARLAAFCDLDQGAQMAGRIGRASASVKGLSDSATAKAIGSGNRDELVGSWMKRVGADDLAQAQAVLDHFPGCPYRADDPMPLVDPAAEPGKGA